MSAADATVLREPVKFYFSGVEAPNRIVKSAMTELICEWPEDEAQADERGKPTPAYAKLYEVWGSEGGLGVNIFGNFACDRRYPEAKGNPILDPMGNWDQVAAFKPIFTAAKKDGAVVLCQLSHAGRQTQDSICETPISSSNVKCGNLGPKSFNTPRRATTEEIRDIVDRFAFAAKVCYDAGAHGVQLHAAHGYLLSQFLSPDVNLRTDAYGGSLENRSRIIFEIIDAIKKTVNDTRFVLSIKINSADFSPEGFSAEDCRILTQKLEEAGLDLIELSGGTYETFAKTGGFNFELVELKHEVKRESTAKREAFFLQFADQIRPYLKHSKLLVTGGFRTVVGMASAIQSGACDLVGLARPLTAEPDLARRLLKTETPAVEGSKPNLVPGMLQTGSANYQIVEIGEGRPISDLSDKKVAQDVVDSILGMKNAYVLQES